MQTRRSSATRSVLLRKAEDAPIACLREFQNWLDFVQAGDCAVCGKMRWSKIARRWGKVSSRRASLSVNGNAAAVWIHQARRDFRLNRMNLKFETENFNRVDARESCLQKRLSARFASNQAKDNQATRLA